VSPTVVWMNASRSVPFGSGSSIVPTRIARQPIADRGELLVDEHER
jgi:hypothetical protein